MADFNKVLDPGDFQNGTINTVVEISMGSTLKIEYRRKTATFELDRVEPNIFAKPTNYGFIPQTLDEDGDELDTLIVINQRLTTGIHLKAKIIGVLNFEDDGEMDHKIVCVPEDDRNTGNMINSLEDLGDNWKKQIESHFTHYKDLKKPGSTKVLGWGDLQAAKKIIEESIQRYSSQPL
ncbi:inorganic diphosphatase [Candidatus Microgenomates bacterium]|nr:inorganic diphosphatase [Candidatus Microgenomates bacterium]